MCVRTVRARASKHSRVCACVCARTYQSLESRHESAVNATGWRERRLGPGPPSPLITDKDRLWSCLLRRLFRAFPLAASAGPPENIARPSVRLVSAAAVTVHAPRHSENGFKSVLFLSQNAEYNRVVSTE